ncbi:prolipoprotein diacylglyceryl transferase [Hyphomicrobium sp.]|uniref:prolipoprotein diacylglyceryl transferase n=1 Tax=Hyphomicrobium sp. TaxID=82 RepID=UPI002E35F819|nr:prolipoprotein diacylglyceryl transferase [Hyphomicrobium sp.]HEX2839866.1 prolipoprotein diacylglyceryl transferase [Hyphomicrobium sp.]
MNLLAIPFPDFDPVAVSIGPLAIKWYGLSYLAGLVLGWVYIRRLLSQPKLWRNETPPFNLAKVDDLLLYITLGVILGGRLGYVFLYEPSTYLAAPLDILAVWKGGMSFHGAFIGCALAMWAFARNNGVSLLSTTDLVTAAVPIGLFFGRLANFINGELFGRVTDAPWAMVFPHAKYLYPDVEPATRHPSQLYEAALEGLVLFVILRLLTHSFGALKSPGLVTGTFLTGYALARSFSEVFREPHAVHFFNIGPFTAGQVYSLPMLLGGLYLIWLARQQAASSRP